MPNVEQSFSGESLLPRWVIRYRKRIGVLVLGLFTALFGSEIFQIQQLFKGRDTHYQTGQKELNNGSLSKARNEFNKSLKIDSKFANGYYGLGKVDRLENKFSDAEENFSTAVKLDPQHARAYFAHAKLLLEMENWDAALGKINSALILKHKEAESYYLQGTAYEGRKGESDLEQAKDSYTKAIEIPPKNYGPACFHLGKLLSSEENFNESVDYLTPYLADKKAEHYLEALLLRAKAQHELTNYEEAIADWTEAIKVTPESATSFLGRAQAQLATKQYTEAIKDFTEANQLDPSLVDEAFRQDHSEAVCGQAEILIGKEQYKEAKELIEAFDKVHTTSTPEAKKLLAKCYFQIGEQLLKKNPGVPGDKGAAGPQGPAGPQAVETPEDKQLKEAIGFISKAIEIDSENTSYRLKRGELYQRINNYSEAIADFTVVIETKPELPALLARGSTYLLVKDLKKAEEDFTAALKIDPKHIPALLARGNIYLTNSNYDSAIDDLGAILEAGNPKAKTEVTMSLIHAYEKRAEVHFAKRDYEPAISDLTQAIELDGEESEPFYRRGQIYALIGDHEKAIEDLSVVINMDESRAEVYLARAKSRVEFKQTEQAVDDYSAALKLKKDYLEAIVGRAAAHHQLKHPEEEIADWTLAIKLNPKDARAWAGRGLAHLVVKDYLKARSDFAETSKLDKTLADSFRKEHAVAYYEAGEILMAKKQYEAAAKLFVSVNEIHPTGFPDLKKVLANCYFQIGLEKLNKKQEPRPNKENKEEQGAQGAQGAAGEQASQEATGPSKKQVEEAIVFFSKAVDIDPENTQYRLKRGTLYLQVNNYQGAIADLTIVLEKNPQDIQALVGRGTAYQLQKDNDLEKSETDFTAALAISSNHNAALLGRGEVRLATGKYDGAIDDLQKALDGSELAAKTPLINAYGKRAEMRLKAKDYSGAIDDSNKVLALDPALTKEVNLQLATAYRLHGKELFDKKDFKNALPTLEKVITFSPDDPNAHAILGDCQQELGESQLALTSYRKVIELRDKNPETIGQEDYVRVLVEIGEFERQAAKTFTQTTAAIKTFTKAITEAGKRDVVKPQIVGRAYWGRAKTRFDFASRSPIALENHAALFKDAIKDYQQARNLGLKDDQELTKALVNATRALGTFYYDAVQKADTPLNTLIKGLDDALTQFESANKLEANNVLLQDQILVTLAQRGQSLLKASKLTAAVADFDRVIEKKPKDLQSLVGRGTAHQLLKKPKEAEADYTAALAINANQLRALRGRGEIRLSDDNYDGAITDLQKAYDGSEPAAKTPLIDAYRKRGEKNLETKDYPAAIDDFDKTLTLEPKLDKEINPQLATAFRLNGKDLFNKKEFKNAVTNLDKAIKLSPDDLNAYAIRGDCQRELGDIPSAKTNYDKVIQLRKGNPGDISLAGYLRVLVGLAEIERQASSQKQTTAEKLQQLTAAIAIFDQSLAEAKKSADVEPRIIARAYWGRAKAEVDLAAVAPDDRQKLFQSAVNQYQQARNLGLKDDQDLINDLIATAGKLGSLYYRSVQKPDTPLDIRIKGLGDALTQFELAVSLRKDNLPVQEQILLALAQRGQALLKSSKYTAAVADFDRVIKQKPKDLQSLVGRATSHQLLKNPKEAEADFTAALVINPNQLRALRGRGEVRLTNSNYDGAIDDLQKANNGNEPAAKTPLIDAYQKRAQKNLKAKDYPATIVDFNNALKLDSKLEKEIDPQLAVAYHLHGKNLFDKKEFKDAATNLDEAISRSPNNPNACIVRGDCRRELKLLSGALQDYRKVIELRDKNPDAIAQQDFVRVLVEIADIERQESGRKKTAPEKAQQLKDAVKTFTRAANEAGELGEAGNPILARAHRGRAGATVDLTDVEAENRETLLQRAIKDYHQARNLGLKEDQAVTHELVVAFSKIGSYYLDSTQKAGTPLDTKIKGLNTALTQFELAAGLKNDDLGLRQRVIETLVQLGQTLVQADKLDEAIKTLEDALAKDPKQQPKWAGKISRAYFLRGMTHYRAGGFALAIADYEAGEKYEVTPDTNRSRLLAECQLGLQLLPRDPEGDKANAIAHLEKSLPLDPKLQEAVEKLTAKLLFVPKIKTNQDILDELAVEMKALYPEPANFQITIEIPPADAEAKVEAEIARDKINLQLDLARLTLGGVRIPKVIRDTYTPIIELGKVTPEAYFARGLAYRTLNMDKQAALDFKIAGVMSRLPRSEQITRSHYPYFEFVQGCERMLILEAKAKIIPPKKTKGVFELAEDVRAEIKRLEK